MFDAKSKKSSGGFFGKIGNAISDLFSSSSSKEYAPASKSTTKNFVPQMAKMEEECCEDKFEDDFEG